MFNAKSKDPCKRYHRLPQKETTSMAAQKRGGRIAARRSCGFLSYHLRVKGPFVNVDLRGEKVRT